MPRVLISVSNKDGVVELARVLDEHGWEIVSTGGTAATIRKAGIEVREVSEVTGFPECMDGRLKTLHPTVLGGLLAREGIDDPDVESLGFCLFDMIVVNLYPFERVAGEANSQLPEVIEQIDIGGPTMIRAAAKNYRRVLVVTSPDQYRLVLGAVTQDAVTDELRLQLAQRVFARMAQYDAAIANYLARQLEGDTLE